jgi:hypothetical protein
MVIPPTGRIASPCEAWVLDFAGFGLADCNPKVAVASAATIVRGGTGRRRGWKNLGNPMGKMEKYKGKGGFYSF